jgi:hypothetical protein
MSVLPCSKGHIALIASAEGPRSQLAPPELQQLRFLGFFFDEASGVAPFFARDAHPMAFYTQASGGNVEAGRCNTSSTVRSDMTETAVQIR